MKNLNNWCRHYSAEVEGHKIKLHDIYWCLALRGMKKWVEAIMIKSYYNVSPNITVIIANILVWSHRVCSLHWAIYVHENNY